MPPIRRIVLDVLKPHEPSMLEFAQRTAECEGVDGTNAILVEIDEDVQNIKITIEGNDIDYDALKAVIDELGGSVHSIDEIVCGDAVVEESKTPQD